MNSSTLLSAAFLLSSLIAERASADVIASTTFDGRVLSPSNTATSLNWTTRGVLDPGAMTALNAAGAPQPLFDTAVLTKGNFTPDLNTGNGNTFWTTSLSLTVADGSNVTVEKVVFDYVATSAAQAVNVSRRSDFTLTLINPAGVTVGAVDVVDIAGGNNLPIPIPTVTATFPALIPLADPGAYTLRIKGGDFLGTDETGNHTGIDNLSIQGIVESTSDFRLIVIPNGGAFDFSWNSRPGKQYDLLTSTDLATPVAEWAVYDPGLPGPTGRYENIPATGTTTTLTAVSGIGTRRFFAMREENVPPRPPLLSEGFEVDGGGFTTAKTSGSDWQWGAPTSSGPGGSVTTGNGSPSSAKCWGINIGNPGSYANPTTATRLISPMIDLTEVAAATLSFAQAVDFPLDDTAVVRIFNVDTGLEITTSPFPLTLTDGNISGAVWQSSGPHPLPGSARIRIEWQFNGTGGSTTDYLGWYIDDVLVKEVP